MLVRSWVVAVFVGLVHESCKFQVIVCCCQNQRSGGLYVCSYNDYIFVKVRSWIFMTSLKLDLFDCLCFVLPVTCLRWLLLVWHFCINKQMMVTALCIDEIASIFVFFFPDACLCSIKSVLTNISKMFSSNRTQFFPCTTLFVPWLSVKICCCE